MEADVYIKFSSPDGRARFERHTGKVSGALAGISQVWKGQDAQAAARGFFSAFKGGLESAINAAFKNANILSLVDNDSAPRNYAHPQGQKALSEDDPETITSEGSKNCRFSISFKSGTFYENNKQLPNGPGEIQYKGGTYIGLGFTVEGTTKGGGGIGRIGKEVNPNNPKGQWTLDQFTSNYSKQNGQFVTIDSKSQQGGNSWRDIDLKGYYFATDWTNKFSRYDHPSLRANVPDTFKNQSFLIKVYRGKEVCQAEFHIVQRGNTIHWGRGAEGAWPQ